MQGVSVSVPPRLADLAAGLEAFGHPGAELPPQTPEIRRRGRPAGGGVASTLPAEKRRRRLPEDEEQKGSARSTVPPGTRRQPGQEVVEERRAAEPFATVANEIKDPRELLAGLDALGMAGAYVPEEPQRTVGRARRDVRVPKGAEAIARTQKESRLRSACVRQGQPEERKLVAASLAVAKDTSALLAALDTFGLQSVGPHENTAMMGHRSQPSCSREAELCDLPRQKSESTSNCGAAVELAADLPVDLGDMTSCIAEGEQRVSCAPDIVAVEDSSSADEAGSREEVGSSEPLSTAETKAVQVKRSKEELDLHVRSSNNESKSKKYLQAKEEAGVSGSIVEVLCFMCRRSKDNTVQKTMTSFFKARVLVATDSHLDSGVDGQQRPVDTTVCAKCRRPMLEKCALVSTQPSSRGCGALPQLQRLKAYQRSAEKQNLPFLISERSACALMRKDCVGCGAPSPTVGHGLTRLRKWPEGMARPERGGFMGPYAECNLAAACKLCNMLKGYHTVRGFVERCKHIASKQTPGENFGEFPHRFRDNVSKRSRSCYITKSSTHTKTHAIANEEFNRIVNQRCYYCHKEPRKPKTLGPDDRGHFNGLDRLDSTNRVYTSETAVACCGDCNIMKYRWTVDSFLDHCRKVARFSVDRVFDGDSEAEGDTEAEAAEDAEGACELVADD